MKRKKLFVFISFLLIIVAYVNREFFNAYFAQPDDTEFVEWQDLKLGQKGFGLTVFQGVKPERFYVEFDGVIPHPLSKREKLILVRMGYPLRNSQVLAGMSGSPVYFKHNDKWCLAGAIAFSVGNLSMGKSLGGITPIQAMINPEKSLGITIFTSTTSKNLNMMNELTEQKNYSVKMLPSKIVLKQNTENTGALNQVRFLTRPKSGEAVSMALVDGDYKLFATCTITYVTENKFWACGHPFLNEGDVVMPAFKGNIGTSFKSPLEAFKLPADYNESFGYIHQDNLFAVEGKIDDLPQEAMIKSTLLVAIGDSKKSEQKLKIFKHRIYSRLLIERLNEKLLGDLWSEKNKATVRTESVISLSNQSPLKLQDSSVIDSKIIMFGPFVINSGGGWPIYSATKILGQLMNSDWHFNVKSIDTKVQIEAGEKFLEVDSYALLDKKNKPVDEASLGDGLKLILGLQSPHRQEKFVLPLLIKIPKKLNLKKSQVSLNYLDATIFVESGNQYQEKSGQLERNPDNEEEFLEQLLINEKDHGKIYIQLVFPPTETEKAVKQLPELKENIWNKVKNFEFLRDTDPSERKVIIQEIDSPKKDYLLNIKFSIRLKINIREKEKTVPPKINN